MPNAAFCHSCRCKAVGQLTLIHSGILYSEERDPRAFFAALRRLKSAGAIIAHASRVRIVLRATGSESYYQAMLDELGIADIVALVPPVPYRAALQEMLTADGLLLFQAAVANHQVPAKLYEYMRAGRPILALTDPAGDTAQLLREMGCAHIADIADAASIHRTLTSFIEDWKAQRLQGVDRRVADRFSRRSRTRELAELLDQLTQQDIRIVR